MDSVPSNVNSSHQEALLYVFEDDKAVIKMITKGRSSTMRHVSRTHRVALDWLFDRINLDPQIQIKSIDTKNQLADMLTKGNFTRNEWNHLLCLFNISHFSSAECFEVMSKRKQKESSEERVTAKSRPMINLIARAPSTLSSSASESPGKTRHESQNPPSPQTEKYDRTVRPVVSAHSSSYSEWNIDKTSSSQEWKSDELMDDKTEKPVVCPQRGARTSQTRFSREHKNVILEEEENHDRTTERPVVCRQRGAPQQFVIGDDGTEADSCTRWMIKCNKGKNDLQWMLQKRAKNILWCGECSCLQHWNHLNSWERITQTIGIPSRTQKISQWNKCSTSLRNWCPRWDLWSENDWLGKSFHGSICLWLVMNKSPASSTQKSSYFQILYCVLARHTRTPIKCGMGVVQSTLEHRTLDRIDGEPVEFEWNVFPGFNALQLSQEVQELLLTPENFTRRIIFMSMFNDISGSKDNKTERVKCSTRFSICKKIWSRTMAIPRAWIREEVVFYQWRQSTRWTGQNCRKNDARRKRTPSLPDHESIVQRSAQEQRRWKIVDPQLCRSRHDSNCFSHNYLCKSVQSLRSSRRNVSRIWILSWLNGETLCGRTVEFLIRAKRDQDKCAFE